MIAKLSGRLDATGEDWAIVDVGGVGYLVHCSSRTLAALGEVGEACTVHTELQVSENDMRLLGFAEQAERDWFRLLTTVQGVGARVGLAIMGALSSDQLIQAIAAGDKAAITQAPGVGPKLAVRILSELKDKVGALTLGAGAGPAGATVSGGAEQSGNVSDAASALVNLGYNPSQALGAVARAAAQLGENAAVESLIRGGLGELAPADGGGNV